MEDLITALLASELPFRNWALVLIWFGLFIANHWIAHKTRRELASQTVIGYENLNVVTRAFEPRFLLAQIAVAAVVFGTAAFDDRAFYVFFVGGFTVTAAFSLGLNAQAFIYARALRESTGVKGRLELSTRHSQSQAGYRLLCGAMAIALAGLITAHLAFLGCAFFMGMSGLGYLRRAGLTPSV